MVLYLSNVIHSVMLRAGPVDRYAVKCTDKDRLDEEDMALALDEASILKSLNHPNIMKVPLLPPLYFPSHSSESYRLVCASKYR